MFFVCFRVISHCSDILIIWNFKNSNIIQINAINYYFNTGTFKNTIYQFIYICYSLLHYSQCINHHKPTPTTILYWDDSICILQLLNGLAFFVKNKFTYIQVFQEITHYQSQCHVLGNILLSIIILCIFFLFQHYNRFTTFTYP